MPPDDGGSHLLHFFKVVAEQQPEVWREMAHYGPVNTLIDLLLLAGVMAVVVGFYWGVVALCCAFAKDDDPMFGSRGRNGAGRGGCRGQRRRY